MNNRQYLLNLSINRQDLLNLSYPSDNEKKLKLDLRAIYEEYGFNKTFLMLSHTNKFLLNKCNIDENSFNYILFKNYILTLNSNIKNDKLFLTDLSTKLEDKIDIEKFNLFIMNNMFDYALWLYEESYTIYQILCFTYIKNLSKSESDKIMQLPEKLVKDTEEKITLLQKMDLSLNRKNEEKKYTKQVASAR